MKSAVLALLLGGARALVTKGAPPDFDLSQNASLCLGTNASRLAGGEEGLFASCELAAGTLLGEFKGKEYTTAWQVPNEGTFAWKIPSCIDEHIKVLRRVDVDAWSNCGVNGFKFIDAASFDNPKLNPLRFVQQAQTQQQRKLVNVDLFIADQHVFYYTTQAIHEGSELLIGADRQSWAHARGWHAGIEPGDEAGSEKPVHHIPRISPEPATAHIIAKMPSKRRQAPHVAPSKVSVAPAFSSN